MRILFITIGSLGDLLILTPALKAMKLSFPKSVITVLAAQYRYYTKSLKQEKEIFNLNAKGGVLEVLRNNPYVDEIIEVNRGELRLLKGFNKLIMELKIIKYLRKVKFDTVISTRNIDRFTLWAYATGAKVRVGQKQKFFAHLLTSALDIDIEDINVLEYFNTLTAAGGAKVESCATEFYIPRDDQLWADEFVSKHKLNNYSALVAIHPGATHPSRIWPPENFAKIADELQSNNSTKVLLCGSQFDIEIINKIKNHLNKPVIDVDEGEGNINRLAAIFNRCDICITNDSGPRHLAVAVGSRSIAIMLKSKINAWKIYNDSPKMVVLPKELQCPVCPGDRCKEIVPQGETFGTYCIRSVSVPEVLDNIQEMLVHKNIIN